MFYESPNRLIDTLNNIKEIFGAEKQIAIGRELTKIYEEVKVGTVDEIINYYEKNTLKGEIVAMIYAQEENNMSEQEINEKIAILKEEGFSPKDISKIISKLYGINKNKVYDAVLKTN